MGMDGARPAPASCISSRISARLPTYDPCTVRLRSGQSGSDARSSPPKSPTTTSRPRVAMTPSPRAALLSDPTKSMAAAAPPPVARRMRLAASGARASTTSAPASAPAWRVASSTSATTMEAPVSASASRRAAKPTPPRPMMTSGRPSTRARTFRTAPKAVSPEQA